MRTPPGSGAIGCSLQREARRRESPYLLIGVGRWGANEPWLGILVEWDEISGTRVNGLPRLSLDAFAGQPFFSKPHRIPGGISHGQSRSRRGFRELEVVVGAILRGRARLRAAFARADEWAIQPRDDFQNLIRHRMALSEGDYFLDI